MAKPRVPLPDPPKPGDRPADFRPTSSGPSVDAVTGDATVGSSHRNGHASVLARIQTLLRAAPARAVRAVHLSDADERALRDGDAQQLDRRGMDASNGGGEAWRTYLLDHFRVRYGIALRFGAADTRIP